MNLTNTTPIELKFGREVKDMVLEYWGKVEHYLRLNNVACQNKVFGIGGEMRRGMMMKMALQDDAFGMMR